MFERKLTKKITVGGVEIGALSPVSVQSMCNTKTHDVEATVEQIKRLRAAGCDGQVEVTLEPDAGITGARLSLYSGDASKALEAVAQTLALPVEAIQQE